MSIIDFLDPFFPDEIIVNVETMMGVSTQIPVVRESRVVDLKLEIEDELDVFVDDQILLFNNLPLDDTRTLDSYGIESGNTVQLVLRLGLFQNQRIECDQSFCRKRLLLIADYFINNFCSFHL